jgi:hypothetical protein
MRFHIEKGAGIYGSNDPNDYASSHQWSNGRSVKTIHPLIGGINLINVSTTGESEPSAYRIPNTTEMSLEASIVDGVGWSWWCRANCMPRIKLENQLRCDHFNPNNGTLPSGGQGRPVLIGFQNCTDVLVSYIIALNSPYSVVNIENSSDISLQMNVRSPRSVGYPRGIDPTSCVELFSEPLNENFSTSSDAYPKKPKRKHGVAEAENYLKRITVLWDISTRRPGRAYVDLFDFFVWRHVCSSASAFLLLVEIKAEWTASPCPLLAFKSKDPVEAYLYGMFHTFFYWGVVNLFSFPNLCVVMAIDVLGMCWSFEYDLLVWWAALIGFCVGFSYFDHYSGGEKTCLDFRRRLRSMPPTTRHVVLFCWRSGGRWLLCGTCRAGATE